MPRATRWYIVVAYAAVPGAVGLAYGVARALLGDAPDAGPGAGGLFAVALLVGALLGAYFSLAGTVTGVQALRGDRARFRWFDYPALALAPGPLLASAALLIFG